MYDAVEVQQLIAKRELKMLQKFDQVSGDEMCTSLIMMIFLSSDTSFLCLTYLTLTFHYFKISYNFFCNYFETNTTVPFGWIGD